MTILLWVILLLPVSFVNCRRLTDDDIRRIEALINTHLQDGVYPGLGLSIVSDQGRELVGGYGTADLEKNTPYSAQTLTYTASIGKAFTAALVSKMIGEHPLYNLTTPVKTIMGDELHLSKVYRTRHATFIDLLAHRVGHLPNNFLWMLNNVDSREDYMRSLYLFPTTIGFRESMTYSNSMYTLAAYALRSLFNGTWEQHIQEQIFSPLKMDQSTTFYVMSDAERETMAKPYLRDDDGNFRRIQFEAFAGGQVSAPAGAIVTNADDMSKWLLFHVNGGKNEDGVQVVREEDLQNTYTPQNINANAGSPRKPNDTVTYVLNRYSLGWASGYYRGFQILSHSGFLFDYQSRVTLLLDGGKGRKLAVYTAWNGDNGRSGSAVHVLHMYILDLLLGVQPWLNVTDDIMKYDMGDGFPHSDDPVEQQRYYGHGFEYKSKNQPVAVKSGKALEDYIGIYGHFGYGNFTVYMNSTTQQLGASYGQAVADLTQVEDGLFLVKTKDLFWFLPEAPVEFSASTGGEIDTLYVPIFPATFKKGLKMIDAPSPPEDPCP